MNRHGSSLTPLICAAGLLLAAGQRATSAEPLYLVKDGKPQAAIVVEETPKKKKAWFVQWAVRALQGYVRQMTGAKLTAVLEKDAPDGPAIHVGQTALAKSLDLGLGKLDRDGFVVTRAGNAVILAGPEDFGTIQAARVFLEEVCGFRWFMPGPFGKVIPKSRDIVVKELDLVVEPSYVSRFMSGLEVVGGPRDADDWYRWMGMHRRYPAIHNIGPVVNPRVYGKEHPEYFPLIGGKRVVMTRGKITHDWQPCLSNPDVQRICLEAARNFFKEKPTAECFSLAQNDNWGWCQCENCTKMNGGIKYDDHSHRDYSPVYYTFLNNVCQELEKDFPDKKLAAYAYQCGTIKPPPFKLHRNIVVHMVNDHSHFHFDARFRKQELDFIKSWSGVATTLGFHEHHFDNGGYAPRLMLRSTADMLKSCNAQGVRAYHGEEYPHWGLSTPKTYITARLLWDVNADVEALLDDFCQRFFEEASAPMRKYYARLEEIWNTQPALENAPRIRHPRRGRHSLILLTPGIMEECFGYLADALELAKQDVVRQRIRHIWKTLRLTDYYVQREFIYKRIDPTRGLTPKTFAEMVSNANAMHHLTLAVRRYMQEHILDDPLTFHAGLWPKRDRKWSKPQYIGLDSYYCEIGAGVSGFLMNQERDSWEKDQRPTQEELNRALHQRFDELSKLLQTPDPKFPGEQGPAWATLSGRIRDYLDGTALVPRLKSAPKLDGAINEEEWQATPVLKLLHPCVRNTRKEDLLKYLATVRVAYDDQALYVAYSCTEESLANLQIRHDARDSSVWNDDSADFVVLPAGTAKEGFYHYIINASGAVYDAKGRGASSKLWNSDLKIATGRDEDSAAWIVETAIAWSDFGETPKSGAIWRAQFSRADPYGTGSAFQCRYSTWAPSAAGFNNPDYLGVLLFE